MFIGKQMLQRPVRCGCCCGAWFPPVIRRRSSNSSGTRTPLSTSSSSSTHNADRVVQRSTIIHALIVSNGTDAMHSCRRERLIVPHSRHGLGHLRKLEWRHALLLLGVRSSCAGQTKIACRGRQATRVLSRDVGRCCSSGCCGCVGACVHCH